MTGGGTPRDPWHWLSTRTPARIGLGRTGASLPTREVLDFALAHAQARDAVHAGLDRTALASALSGLGFATVDVESQATSRETYLRRPDLGRVLTDASRQRLTAWSSDCDLAVVLGDGLSARAVAEQGPRLLLAFLPHTRRLGLRIPLLALAQGARVALGDDVGATLGARLVAVLIGERPGLSAADSLGVYLTFAPKPGRHDAERNCISNIRPGGHSAEAAAANLAWLIEAALARGLTGVGLKDESDTALAQGTGPGTIGGA